MSLPVRVPRPGADPQAAARRLIEGTYRAPAWSYGRAFVFEIMDEFAEIIGDYYTTTGDLPLSAFEFEPGSAERFAYGYVGAIVEGSEPWKWGIRHEFYGSCEQEVVRAMSILAAAARTCLYIMLEIATVEAAISTL